MGNPFQVVFNSAIPIYDRSLLMSDPTPPNNYEELEHKFYTVYMGI